MTQKAHKKLNLFKRLITILISAFVLLVLLSIILFNFYKDDIGREVLLRVNKIQKGELAFKDISFNPFIHFPNISLTLMDIEYYELSSESRNVDSIPIIKLDKLFVALDVIDLIKGDVIVSDILLKNGKITLITYADSSLNITNPFITEHDTIINQEESSNKTSDFELNLEKIMLRNIDVSYNQLSNHNYSAFSIHSLDASLSYSPDTIKSFVNLNITINEAMASNEIALANKNFQIETSFAYDRILHKAEIAPSKLLFEKANFTMFGNIDLLGDGYIDMAVKGGDKDLSILNLFLTHNVVQNIEQGTLFFDASIVGLLYKGIPQIDCSFGIADVKIDIPNTKKSINNLSLEGVFQSGREKELSEATLEIKKISAKLPGGNIDATVSIKNFNSPIFDIHFDMKTELDGFDDILNLKVIDSLTGKLVINSHLSGQFDLDGKHIVNKKGNSTIVCDNISFVVPKITKVQNVEGLIKFDPDTLFFEDFSLEIGTSDFDIVGSLSNVFYLISGVDKDINGELHIVSNTYDFPDFFSYDKRVARSFPYKFKNISLDVGITTSTSKLTDFIVVPKIDFNIHHLETEIENFLPQTVINSGLFTLGEIDSALNLNFANFNASIAGSKLIADVVYNSPRVNPDWLTVDVEVSDLNPQKTFVYWAVDSISNSFNGLLDGSMYLDLVFSLDTVDFDTLNFTASKLSFVNTSDTFNVQKLELAASDIYYNLNESNILENLNCEVDLAITDISMAMFNVDELKYDISVKKGAFHITPLNTHLFNKNGEGLFVLKPFDEIPTYELNYKVQQFDVARLFNTFLEDTLVVGKMNLDLAVSFSGITMKEIEQSLNGKLLVGGKNLTLYGLDLDKTIERFKRSQKFTYADVGAVLLMGPAGILVTKGSDYASLIVLNSGESCKVVEISSDWGMANGVVNLVDVAFTTNDNRMAAKGWLNLLSDSLIIEIALLNNKGCSIYSQPISGKIEDPEMGKVKVVKSLLAPVTNLVTKVGEVECDVFYDGKVKQPPVK